jgi:hypothetical protein
MNSTRLPIIKIALFLAAVCGFIFAATPKALASAADEIDSALATSQAWVALIDAGKYDDSYNAASSALHDKVQEDRWSKVLKALRSPWGAVVSRKQTSHLYKPNGMEGSEGEFMVITYDTSFQEQAAVKEVIVLKWEDGKWRPAGYNAAPKALPDAGTPPPSTSTTEMHTEPHVTPAPQNPPPQQAQH